MIIFEASVMWLLCGSEVRVVLRVFFIALFSICDGKDGESCMLDTLLCEVLG
jgi:hypothetical protein